MCFTFGHFQKQDSLKKLLFMYFQVTVVSFIQTNDLNNSVVYIYKIVYLIFL